MTTSTYSETAASLAARAFFWPSLAWNVTRERLDSSWHWCDEITEYVVLGAIPTPGMIDHEFKQMGVKAVVTLNEEFEIFVSPGQWAAAGMDHLHLPTVDFMFAPPLVDLHRGADFIAGHAARGNLTYVHCKAGRGRSTVVVLCYLIKYHGFPPVPALEHVRARRHQIRLAPAQWQSVEDFWRACCGDSLAASGGSKLSPLAAEYDSLAPLTRLTLSDSSLLAAPVVPSASLAVLTGLTLSDSSSKAALVANQGGMHPVSTAGDILHDPPVQAADLKQQAAAVSAPVAGIASAALHDSTRSLTLSAGAANSKQQTSLSASTPAGSDSWDVASQSAHTGQRCSPPCQAEPWQHLPAGSPSGILSAGVGDVESADVGGAESAAVGEADAAASSDMGLHGPAALLPAGAVIDSISRPRVSSGSGGNTDHLDTMVSAAGVALRENAAAGFTISNSNCKGKCNSSSSTSDGGGRRTVSSHYNGSSNTSIDQPNGKQPNAHQPVSDQPTYMQPALRPLRSHPLEDIETTATLSPVAADDGSCQGNSKFGAVPGSSSSHQGSSGSDKDSSGDGATNNSNGSYLASGSTDQGSSRLGATGGSNGSHQGSSGLCQGSQGFNNGNSSLGASGVSSSSYQGSSGSYRASRVSHQGNTRLWAAGVSSDAAGIAPLCSAGLNHDSQCLEFRPIVAPLEDSFLESRPSGVLVSSPNAPVDLNATPFPLPPIEAVPGEYPVLQQQEQQQWQQQQQEPQVQQHQARGGPSQAEHLQHQGQQQQQQRVFYDVVDDDHVDLPVERTVSAVLVHAPSVDWPPWNGNRGGAQTGFGFGSSPADNNFDSDARMPDVDAESPCCIVSDSLARGSLIHDNCANGGGDHSRQLASGTSATCEREAGAHANAETGAGARPGPTVSGADSATGAPGLSTACGGQDAAGGGGTAGSWLRWGGTVLQQGWATYAAPAPRSTASSV